MAVKGRAYEKTRWAWQERPVASSKLNAWDDSVERAFELVHFLLSMAWGGGDGVVRHATEQDLKVVQSEPAALAVDVEPGYAFIARFPFKLAERFRTDPVTPPQQYGRVDLVQARLDTWEIDIVAGLESGTPVAPQPYTNCLPLAQLHLRTGMTCIRDTDDGVNGYIVDVRQYV